MMLPARARPSVAAVDRFMMSSLSSLLRRRKYELAVVERRIRLRLERRRDAVNVSGEVFLRRVLEHFPHQHCLGVDPHRGLTRIDDLDRVQEVPASKPFDLAARPP